MKVSREVAVRKKATIELNSDDSELQFKHKHFSSRSQNRQLQVLRHIEQVHKRINSRLYAPVAVQIIEIHTHTMFVTPSLNREHTSSEM